MPVTVSKPAFNLREALNSLRKKTGLFGAQLLGAATASDAHDMLGQGASRNMIINGAMDIDQRNAGSAVTQNVSSGSQAFYLDRWQMEYSSGIGNYTVQQVSDAPPGFSRSFKLTVGSGYGGAAYYPIKTNVEGFVGQRLAYGTASAKPSTLSFWVKASVAGMYAVYLRIPGVASCNRPFWVTAANTWQFVSVTFPGYTASTPNTTNSEYVVIRWVLGSSGTNGTSGVWGSAELPPTSTGTVVNLFANSGATFQLTGVQFEVGSVATPFEYRPYATELALCQRYFFVYNSKRSLANVFNNSDMQAPPIQFPVSMRTAPTGTGITGPSITTSGNWGIYGATNGWGNSAGYTPTFNTTVDGAAISFGGVSGVSNNLAYLVEGGARFSAEM